VHPDEYVVVPDRRLFDVSELQNVGRAVSSCTMAFIVVLFAAKGGRVICSLSVTVVS
jgi:hypothetical protein